MTYTASDRRRTELTVQPFGIVAHSGRSYSSERTRRARRTFRISRISTPEMPAGTRDVPAGFAPPAEVIAGIARVPYQQEVSVLVQGGAEEVRAQLPPGVTITAAAAPTAGAGCRFAPSG